MENKSPAACCFTNINELTKLEANDWDVSVFRSVDGGGTGEEFPDNLKIDGSSPGNKWYDYESGETWIEAQFINPTRIKFFQMKSANDCPNRDPYQISIQIRNSEEEEFQVVGNYDNIIFEERYQVKDFNIDTGKEVNFMRIVITKNLSFAEEGHWGDGTQLAQVIFYR